MDEQLRILCIFELGFFDEVEGADKGILGLMLTESCAVALEDCLNLLIGVCFLTHQPYASDTFLHPLLHITGYHRRTKLKDKEVVALFAIGVADLPQLVMLDEI